jgi:hypothetical protein
MLCQHNASKGCASSMEPRGFPSFRSDADMVDAIMINRRLSRPSVCRATCQRAQRRADESFASSLCPAVDTASNKGCAKQLDTLPAESSFNMKDHRQQRPRSPTIRAHDSSASNVTTVKVEGQGPMIVHSMVSAVSTSPPFLTIISEDNVGDRPRRIKTSPRQASARPVSPEAIRAVSRLPRKADHR